MSYYLERGVKVLFSTRGHNGFFYPDPENWETTAVCSQVIPQAWLGSDLTAVLISEDSIFGTGRDDRLIPVWVEKSDLIKE
tara:strand:+ start:104 stop:346 length:243 start_codon:yes stop_codon:yes gene_type:complete